MRKGIETSLFVKKETYNKVKNFQTENTIRSVDAVITKLLTTYKEHERWQGIAKETYDRFDLFKSTQMGTPDEILNYLLNVNKSYEPWKDVSGDTYARLLRYRRFPNESIDSVINRALDGDKDGR